MLAPSRMPVQTPQLILCGVCGATFTGPSRAARRWRHHVQHTKAFAAFCHDPRAGRFTCSGHHVLRRGPRRGQVCGKAFSCIGALHRHEATHAAKKLKCGNHGCPKMFRQAVHRARHEQKACAHRDRT